MVYLTGKQEAAKLRLKNKNKIVFKSNYCSLLWLKIWIKLKWFSSDSLPELIHINFELLLHSLSIKIHITNSNFYNIVMQNSILTKNKKLA